MTPVYLFIFIYESNASPTMNKRVNKQYMHYAKHNIYTDSPIGGKLCQLGVHSTMPSSPRAGGLTVEVWPYISFTSLPGGRRVHLGLEEANTSHISGELWPDRRRCRGRCGHHGGRWGWGCSRLKHLGVGGTGVGGIESANPV